MNTRSDWIPAFVARLRALDPPDDPAAVNRAALAHLRRGLGRPAGETLVRVGHLFVAVPDAAVSVAVLVAGLFAEHRLSGGEGTLGKALGLYKRNYCVTPAAGDSADRRFIHLVESDPSDLAGRVPHAVRLLAAKNVAVDYAQLLRDLRRWASDDGRVQWAWSRDYWRAELSPAAVPEPVTTAGA